MANNSSQTTVNGISRRVFLKLCSAALGALALSRAHTSLLERALAAPGHDASVTPTPFFQWQNNFLCKTIYPMREKKLRDFLVYYMEVDVWAQYKDKDINDLTDEVDAYKKGWEADADAARKEYDLLRAYFLRADVRADYSNFLPLDEMELTMINNLHAQFADSWPKDIRGERSFVEGMVTNWTLRLNGIRQWIKTHRRKYETMDASSDKYDLAGNELALAETVTLPMAEREMAQLRAFAATYDKIEERKLAWYKMSKSVPNPEISEAEFIATYPADRQVTIRDIAYWKVAEYVKLLADKNQYELLELIRLRFEQNPLRYPQWLQYMVVHFSGMRYASAHGSWADPKDLITRFRVLDVKRELETLDDTEIEKRCKEKTAAYEMTSGAPRPQLALAPEQEWQAKLQLDLQSVKANGPKTRRAGLLALQTDEVTYESQNLSTTDALKKLKEMKSVLPQWAWKEIVKFTTLRVTEVSDSGWEKLTPHEEEERAKQQSDELRAVMDAWENYDPTAWRDEHGRTLELIVTRAVCNETAEHCQHVRGRLPPGGLTQHQKWYVASETGSERGEAGRPQTSSDAQGKHLLGAYYVKPTSEKDYAQGASVLWLKFVNSSTSSPTQWQTALWIETKQKVGLLPAEFKKKKAKNGEWIYNFGGVVTRSRTSITTDKERVVETQWLRWIHEATVAEVAETADGMVVITYETALPGGDVATSAVGIVKMPLSWHLSDGTEDNYNRSFVGYIPEGEAPVESLKTMLDWDKILAR